jgi:hypothetical protein
MSPEKRTRLHVLLPSIISTVVCLIGLLLGFSDYLHDLGGWIAQFFFTWAWGGLLMVNAILGICLLLIARKRTSGFWIITLRIGAILLMVLSLLFAGYMALGFYSILADW